LPRAPQTPATSVSADADPEQLLAEASVYLRYGKRDQAIANSDVQLPEGRFCDELKDEQNARFQDV